MIINTKIQPFSPPLPLQNKRGVFNYMSTPPIYGLIRDLCKETGGPYLEIGCYRGMGLLAAHSAGTKRKPIKVIGIDNFKGDVSKRLAPDHEAVLRRQIEGKKNIVFLKEDYRDALKRLHVDLETFGVVFVDGPHHYRATMNQLLLSAPMVKPGGYILLDDFNLRDVQKASAEFFGHWPAWEKVFEKRTGDRNDPKWWNGVQVWRQVERVSDEEE